MIIIVFFLVCFFCNLLYANNEKAYIKNDTLYIQNSELIQKWIWNDGNISFWSSENKENGSIFLSKSKKPSYFIENNEFVKNISFSINIIEANYLEPKHVAVSIENEHKNLKIKRVFKLYENAPAVKIETYLDYRYLLHSEIENEVNSNGTEYFNKKMLPGQSALFYFNMESQHTRLTAINFYDVTDVNDNLVEERNIIPYKWDTKLKGNIIIGEDLISTACFYVLKEAPNHSSQINYPGFDLKANNSRIIIPISGFSNTNSTQGWIKGYSIMMGVSDSYLGAKLSLRKAIRASILYSDKEHEMIMQNTWGDRGKDGRVSEKFVINEIKKAAKLGITHFQIDDGWQQGLSQNSAHEGGKLWSEWGTEDWMPHNERFPNGIAPVLKVAKKNNMPLGLWFHPSDANNYATWEKDANILIELYESMGIKYFKIDGVKIPTMEAVINFDKFIDKIKKRSNGEIFLNLDATAGVRGGYFTYMNYGNIFLENRYTDWGNYYPFHTLRNLWQMAQYFPPELLQVEVLNKWRNHSKYPKDDIYAPANYSFDYLFAITMAAQPLMWLELVNLPEEAYSTSMLISDYKKIQADFHKGVIMPIGEEPSGRSWTGFQSILSDTTGYLIIYRESTKNNKASISTLIEKGAKIRCKSVVGSPNTETFNVDKFGNIELEIKNTNDYRFYKYEIIK